MKWGARKRNQILSQYFRDKKRERKKGAQEKGRENSPISPPLDPRLATSIGAGQTLNFTADEITEIFSRSQRVNIDRWVKCRT